MIPRALTRTLTRARLVHAFITVTLDPERTSVIADMSTYIGDLRRAECEEGLLSDARVADALMRGLPSLSVDLAALAQLPEGTLGRVFADHVISHGFSADDLDFFMADDLFNAYRDHLAKVHDIWHVVTGFGVDVAGELGLQAFLMAQVPAPLALLTMAAGLLNALIRDPADAPRRLEAISTGWRMGRQARSLFGVNWAGRWAQPLCEVRAAFLLIPVMDREAGGMRLAA